MTPAWRDVLSTTPIEEELEAEINTLREEAARGRGRDLRQVSGGGTAGIQHQFSHVPGLFIGRNKIYHKLDAVPAGARVLEVTIKHIDGNGKVGMTMCHLGKGL